MDAEVAYAFHSEREKHADKFKNQFKNQVNVLSIHASVQSWFKVHYFAQHADLLEKE